MNTKTIKGRPHSEVAPKKQDTTGGTSRRTFLGGMAATVAGFASAPLLTRAQEAEKLAVMPEDLLEVSFTLNGEPVRTAVDTRRTLLDYLREQAGLTGTKVGCRHGQCGACTVHIGGQPKLSCLTLTAQLGGREVTTIEGLAAVAAQEGYETDDGLHPVQAAFIEHDAFQCGYCTPGQLMSASATVTEGHASSPEEVREYMSGNLCRCAAYPNITAAILEARDQMKPVKQGGGARQGYHLGLSKSGEG